MTLKEYEQYKRSGSNCIVCRKVMFGETQENIALLSVGRPHAGGETYYIYFHTACLREIAGDQYMIE